MKIHTRKYYFPHSRDSPLVPWLFSSKNSVFSTSDLPFTHICRWRRLCQTALSSAVGARKMRTRLRGRLCGLQPPLFTISAWPFSALPFGFTATCNRNSVGRFRTMKHASAMLDNRRGSSVTKSTRSREIRANTRRSVSSSAQDGCRRARPSTLARAPPKSLEARFDFSINIIVFENWSRIKIIITTSTKWSDF